MVGFPQCIEALFGAHPNPYDFIEIIEVPFTTAASWHLAQNLD